MTTSTLRQLPAEEQAQILLTVAASKHARLSLPTTAANHDLTLAELQTFLNRNGYPSPAVMTASAQRIRAGAAAAPADKQDTVPTTPIPTAGGPYVTALAASALFVDESYQRELDTTRVSKMVATYDPALVGILEVSARETGYAILDGQHRWALAKDLAFDDETSNGDPHLVCRVHTGLTVHEEAELYNRLNTTRKQLTGWDRWKARRSSGDPAVAEIERVATAAGWTVSYRGARGHITATKSLEKVYTLGGHALLDEVLSAIKSAWRDDPEAVTAGIIEGLSHILANYNRDELDLERLVLALSGIVPRQLNARAAASREIHKGTIDKLTAFVIVDEYNQVRRAGQIIPFFDRVRPQTANKGTKRAADLEHIAKVRAWALGEGLITGAKSSYISKAIHAQYAAAHPEGGE